MKTLKDIGNKKVRDFLGCTTGFASDVIHGRKPFPRKKIKAFSEKFGVPIESLIENKEV